MKPRTSPRARCCPKPISGHAEICPGPLQCAVWPVIAPFLETKAHSGRFVVQRSIRYEFFRHREIFRSDVRLWNREQPAGRSLIHRLDEFPAGYSLAGCSPALPASASPAAHHSAAKRTRRAMAFHRTATTPLNFVSHSKGSLQNLRFLPPLEPLFFPSSRHGLEANPHITDGLNS
jgi:hypothetical protein